MDVGLSRRRVRAPRYPSRSGRSRPAWRRWHRRFRRRRRKDRDWVAITATSLPGIAAVAALIFTALQVQATQGQLLTTQQQLRITERGQITDRYNAAISNLGAGSV